ncbi:hypothetical protein BDV98DRAFT_574773 [Pterulicium gracile]|uniref:Uncharacterized protein n=1 Tax=Pterulicium gracile TaxID=1884261 RepID=A0A5C3QA01_9AGAR|nr:hypothetical protein BDV98DRAFT_574773 [Pterula gracilis]
MSFCWSGGKLIVSSSGTMLFINTTASPSKTATSINLHRYHSEKTRSGSSQPNPNTAELSPPATSSVDADTSRPRACAYTPRKTPIEGVRLLWRGAAAPPAATLKEDRGNQ